MLKYCNGCEYLKWDLVKKWHCQVLYPQSRILSADWYDKHIIRPENCIQENGKKEKRKEI